MRHIFSLFLLSTAGLIPLHAAVDNQLLALIPSNARLVTSVDVAAAKNSEFVGFVLGRINTQDHSFDELIQQTGFDPRRDLQDFVFASPGDSTGAQGKFVVLVRGQFDRDRIQASAKAKGATTQTYQGTTIFFMDKSSNGGNGFAFVGDGIAVFGDIGSVEQVLANRGSSSTLDPSVQALIATVGPNNDMWFVSTMGGGFLANHVKKHANNNVPVQALDSILQSSGGIQFGDVVRLSFDAVARSPKDAQSLVDVIRFLGSMVQMNREKGPAMQAFATSIDQMTLQNNADAVHVTLSIPEQSLEQVANLGMESHHHAQH